MRTASSLWQLPAVTKAQSMARQAYRTVQPMNRGARLGAWALSKMPETIQQRPLEPLLNHALQVLIEEGEFDFLNDKCCCISVRDCDLQWNLTLKDDRLVLLTDQTADVTISATVSAFLDLVSQSVDPDTLFFQRQLSIEGDVELGLQVKNLLDALDEEELPVIWRQALTAVKRLVQFER